MRARAGAESNASSAFPRQRHALLRADETDLCEGLRAVQMRMVGQQRGDALRDLVSELVRARVRHLRQEEPRFATVRIDHVGRRRVVDGALHDRRLDPVGAPDALELRQ